MASTYHANFASVLPRVRPAPEIVADNARFLPIAGAERTRLKIQDVETAIHDGDQLYLHGRYQPALDEFRRARAAIYALLHPLFDVGACLRAFDIALPSSTEIEHNLLQMSSQVLDSMRPMVQVHPLRLANHFAAPAPEDLVPFMQVGFHEAQESDGSLIGAVAQGVALLADGKPEAARNLLEQALEDPGEDFGLVAALHLGLAAAYVQTGNPQLAVEAASEAERFFGQHGDEVGAVQARHAQAVALRLQGEHEHANELFAFAARALREIVDTSQPVQVLSATSDGVRALATRDPRLLEPISSRSSNVLTLRVPGRADGWSAIQVADETQRRQLIKPWTVKVPTGGGHIAMTLSADAPVQGDELAEQLYRARVEATNYVDLDWLIGDSSSVACYLTHFYSYALNVKLGDCYHRLGQFNKAEEYYLLALGYTYLNEQFEATALWIRMAANAVAWGDALYKNEDLDGASEQYGKVVTEDGGEPFSVLYDDDMLSVPADEARRLLDGLEERPLPTVNWEIAQPIMIAYGRLQQLGVDLDFYGLLLTPIHTFEYLQGVARGFAQAAVQAEREFVHFKAQQETEQATRRELETAYAMAEAETAARYQQFRAAEEDEEAAEGALGLARMRHDAAVAQREAYKAVSSAELWARAAAMALGKDEDAYFAEISELADRLARGENISGEFGKLAAALTLNAGRRTRAYELRKMDDNIAELATGIGFATDQLQAAVRRTKAAEIGWQAAKQRAGLAAASLTAFDEEFFTPDAWAKMSDVMRDIAGSYLFRAIRIAKLMERSYNFENDTELKVIRNEYGVGVTSSANGQGARLFGGDMLLVDIDSFTFHAITATDRKSSDIKDVISLAETFPAQFEEFRKTGLLAFETELYEFDRCHPGFYGQRIEAVEIEAIGLLPETGLNGTLSAGGVTSFRKRDFEAGTRTQRVDTMALSNFLVRNDGFLYRSDTAVRGLFQGLGLAGTWQLHLPKRSNAFDFRRIFDVHLILYYKARFDGALRTRVLQTPPRPGETDALRTFSLRHDFADSWYAYYRAGSAAFTLDRARMPANQTGFRGKTISVRVVTGDGVANEGITVCVTAPNGATGQAVTNASGLVSSQLPALAAAAGQDPCGAWKIDVLGGASLTEGGKVKYERVDNIQFGVEYSYQFVSEAV